MDFAVQGVNLRKHPAARTVSPGSTGGVAKSHGIDRVGNNVEININGSDNDTINCSESDDDVEAMYQESNHVEQTPGNGEYMERFNNENNHDQQEGMEKETA